MIVQVLIRAVIILAMTVGLSRPVQAQKAVIILNVSYDPDA